MLKEILSRYRFLYLQLRVFYYKPIKDNLKRPDKLFLACLLGRQGSQPCAPASFSRLLRHAEDTLGVFYYTPHRGCM